MSSVCLNCPPACLRCMNQTSCEVCVEGAVLFNGTCKSACPQGYYAQAISSQNHLQYNCTPCSSACSSCNGSSLYDCTTCSSGFYYSNGMCLVSCPNGYFPSNVSGTCAPCPSTCTNCISFSNCSQCVSGYTLSNTYQCSNSDSSLCTVPYCLNCYAMTAGATPRC